MARLSREHLIRLWQRHGRDRLVGTFVESGTYQAKTTLLAADVFPLVYSIELSPVYYRAARKKVQAAQPRAVVLLHEGDSRTWIPRLAEELKVPVFWYLDAHYFRTGRGQEIDGMGGSEAPEDFPLWEELRAVAARPYEDIVVVDDVHAFGRSAPSTAWRDVSLESIAACFDDPLEAVILGDQAVIYR